jgi:hypothetical protein
MAESERMRCFALVGPLTGERRVAQTQGFPIDPEKMLPTADVILLVAGDDSDPGAMLFRYTVAGEFSGDTWHPSLDSAREQVAYEYEDAIGEWVHVPADVDDAHAYVVRYAAERLNSRE